MVQVTRVFSCLLLFVGVVTHTVDAIANHNNIVYSMTTQTTSSPSLSPIKKINTLAPIFSMPTSSPSNDDVPPPTTMAPVPPPVVTPTSSPTTHNNNTDSNTTSTPVSTPHSLPPTNSPTTTNSSKTIAPTTTPNNITTSSPTKTPTNSTTAVPTMAPVITPTLAPTPYGTETPIITVPTTLAPQSPVAPVTVPTNNTPTTHHHFSIFKIIAKTIAWLIIILLSVVAFGAGMSHRYRIYYFLRSLYYTITRFILRLQCTQYILSKLRWNSNHSNNNYHADESILFDSDMNEGLLMRENEYDS